MRVFLGNMLENMSLRFMSISSTPAEESISMDGIFCWSAVSTSIVLSSSLPSRRSTRSFSRVVFWSSLSFATLSGSGAAPKGGDVTGGSR